MTQARLANGITIEWDDFGDAEAEPIVLVMGLGAQMVLWPDAFCEALAARGFRVVRFDNRDIGMSTKLEHLGMPNVLARLVLRKVMGIRMPAPYSLSDMAGDVVGLMDELGIESAHVVGMSMGGMIAQTMAIAWPDRVRSLVSLCSSCGDDELPLGTRDALGALFAMPPVEREAAITHEVETMRAIASPVHFDEAFARHHVVRCFERSTHREGAVRQFAAILAAPPRSSQLRTLHVPATVIHGRLDPLLPLPHGEATARAIPEAALLVLDTMAHDAPCALWPEILDAIEATARRPRMNELRMAA
jgi:pimeloyl-ACP methyl ester carboxylesterase